MRVLGEFSVHSIDCSTKDERSDVLIDFREDPVLDQSILENQL